MPRYNNSYICNKSSTHGYGNIDEEEQCGVCYLYMYFLFFIFLLTLTHTVISE